VWWTGYGMISLNFAPFFNMENMISGHTKDFGEKNCPNLTDFEKQIKSKLSVLYLKLLYMLYSQNFKKIG
jgi:hypothetical protein